LDSCNESICKYLSLKYLITLETLKLCTRLLYHDCFIILHYILCIQRQLEEEISELSTKLAIKEKENVKLKDDKKLLLRNRSESKESSFKQPKIELDKVHWYMHDC